jgi:hypothetical protein
VDAIAIGSGNGTTVTTASGIGSIAIGNGATTLNQNATAIGTGSSGTNQGATALGQAAAASGLDGTAVGRGATARVIAHWRSALVRSRSASERRPQAMKARLVAKLQVHTATGAVQPVISAPLLAQPHQRQ